VPVDRPDKKIFPASSTKGLPYIYTKVRCIFISLVARIYNAHIHILKMLPSEAAANAVKAATEASARLDAALKEAKDTFAEYPHTLIGKVIRYTLVSDINASPKNKRRRASKKKNIPININTNINSYGNGSYTDALVVGCRIEEDTVWYKVFVIDASRTIDKNGDASTQVIRLDSEYTAEWTLLLDRNGNGNGCAESNQGAEDTIRSLRGEKGPQRKNGKIREI